MTNNPNMGDMGMNFEEPTIVTLTRISEQLGNLIKKFDEHLAADQKKQDKIDDQLSKHEAALNQAIGGKIVLGAISAFIGGVVVALIDLFRSK